MILTFVTLAGQKVYYVKYYPTFWQSHASSSAVSVSCLHPALRGPGHLLKGGIQFLNFFQSDGELVDVEFKELGGHWMPLFCTDRNVNGCGELLNQLDSG